ncbi:MAG: pentapeptide repeat-containing protein [Cyanobacteria bacterium P01_D01_bin.1]
MRSQFEQWQSKIRIDKWRMTGVIATSVFLGTVWWYAGMLTTAITGTLLFAILRSTNKDVETSSNLSGIDLSGADLGGAELNGVDFRGSNLNGANLRGADLRGANLSGADLINADLSGADLNRAELRYANLSGADLASTNLSNADLRYANLSGADLKCTFLRGTNLSDANLSGALLFFINSREVLNLEPLQLEAQPSPLLCNVALPAYSKQPAVNPNRDCDRISELLRDRYDISIEEAQEIVDEARQHHWH